MNAIRVGNRTINKEILLDRALNLFCETGKPVSVTSLLKSFGVRESTLGGETRARVREFLKSSDLYV